MRGLGAHRPLSPHPFRHLVDEMGGVGDVPPLALRHIEPGAGERRLDLGAGHSWRFHDAVSPMLRLPHSGGNRRAAEPNIWRRKRIAPGARRCESRGRPEVNESEGTRWQENGRSRSSRERRAASAGRRTRGEGSQVDNEANAAQREYWNTVAGPRWVGLAGLVEARVRKVNDLLLARSAVVRGEKVLEVGCGTGAATVPLAEAVGDGGEVLGVDISGPMLAGARQRISQSGLDNVTLLQADAQTYRFQPDYFDLITSRFGVMFFSDPVAAFRNLRGAARPGGRLCFACWAPLAENPQWLISYEVALRYLGPPAPKDPRAPGPFALADQDYARSILEQAEYEAIEIHRETPDIIGSTPGEEAEFACIMGPSRVLIDEKQPDDATLTRIKQEMTEAFAAHAKGEEMLLPSTIFLVTARRAPAEIGSKPPR